MQKFLILYGSGTNPPSRQRHVALDHLLCKDVHEVIDHLLGVAGRQAEPGPLLRHVSSREAHADCGNLPRVEIEHNLVDFHWGAIQMKNFALDCA